VAHLQRMTAYKLRRRHHDEPGYYEALLAQRK
jgi:hypothetical protein